MPDTVLFACIQNAGRSQIAKAIFNQKVDPSSATAISAGSAPATHVHPEVVEVMREVGVNLEGVQPQKLTQELAATSQVLVTMGCGEACPHVPGVEVVAWQIPDPHHAKDVAAIREIRDYLTAQVSQLIADKGYKLARA